MTRSVSELGAGSHRPGPLDRSAPASASTSSALPARGLRRRRSTPGRQARSSRAAIRRALAVHPGPGGRRHPHGVAPRPGPHRRGPPGPAVGDEGPDRDLARSPGAAAGCRAGRRRARALAAARRTPPMAGRRGRRHPRQEHHRRLAHLDPRRGGRTLMFVGPSCPGLAWGIPRRPGSAQGRRSSSRPTNTPATSTRTSRTSPRRRPSNGTTWTCSSIGPPSSRASNDGCRVPAATVVANLADSGVVEVLGRLRDDPQRTGATIGTCSRAPVRATSAARSRRSWSWTPGSPARWSSGRPTGSCSRSAAAPLRPAGSTFRPPGTTTPPTRWWPSQRTPPRSRPAGCVDRRPPHVGPRQLPGDRAPAGTQGEARGVVVYDDYGHHPTAIRATLEAVRQREPERRIGRSTSR